MSDECQLPVDATVFEVYTLFVLCIYLLCFTYKRPIVMHLKTKIFQSGNSLAVRLPRSIHADVGEAEIWVDEERNIVISPASNKGWEKFKQVLENTHDDEQLTRDDREFFSADDRKLFDE